MYLESSSAISQRAIKKAIGFSLIDIYQRTSVLVVMVISEELIRISTYCSIIPSNDRYILAKLYAKTPIENYVIMYLCYVVLLRTLLSWIMQ